MRENRSEFPCPVCELALLVIELPDGRVPGGAVLACPHCLGLWVRGSSVHALDPQSTAFVPPSEHLSQEQRTLPASRICPKCRVTMDLVACDLQIGPLHLDRCQHCRGLWFDRGELARYTHALHADWPVALRRVRRGTPADTTEGGLGTSSTIGTVYSILDAIAIWWSVSG